MEDEGAGGGMEWREELKKERLERLAAFQRALRAVPRDEPGLLLDEAAIEYWLGVLNDLRLILADELGIDSDDWRQPDGEQPSAPLRLYAYLTGLQGAMLEAMMS